MARPKRNKVWRIVLSVLLLIIISAGGYALWLTHNYKRIITERLPKMVTEGSDSIYHLSIKDISVNLFKHRIIAYGVRLWADTNQVNIRLRQRRHSPNTVSFVDIPFAELYGINWGDMVSKKSFDCSSIIAHNPIWFMQTIKQDTGLSYVEEKSKPATINRMTSAKFEIQNPDVTYHYIGAQNTYYCYLKGGTALLYDWAVEGDINKDTSVFLYAKHGNVVPKMFKLEKDGKIYTTDTPHIDFSSTANSITLQNVRINHMTDVARESGAQLEIYNCKFPSIEFDNFNWNKLLRDDALIVSAIRANGPFIDVHYLRQNFPDTKDKTGSFPNQIIRKFIKTYVKALYVKNGKFLYNEPNEKNENALFQFDDINGSFSNITNIDHLVALNKSCIVKLQAKFMNKSPVTADFDLSLYDPKGHFTVVGTVSNLDGDDVSKQAAAFTIAKVTSFHLSRMEGRVEGDESYAKGNFTMLYNDLKISLFKFKSNDREGKNGPFSFIADATILYPNNPMPGKDARTTTTNLPRDPHSGFMFLIWQSMYLGAQKSAVRDEKFLKLAGGSTEDQAEADTKREKTKKGFFKRLFGRKIFAKKDK